MCHRHAYGMSGGGTEGGLGYEVPLEAILSIPEHTSGILEIFSRAILLGTPLQICENIAFRDYEFLGDRPGPRKYCNKFLSFHTLSIVLNYEMYCV